MATAEVSAAGANGLVPQAHPTADLVASIAQAQTISADEIALYDRQIRLWGVQAQEKIRTANVLLLKAKALANEVAKNLVLAGIGSITVVDHENVTEDDLGSQFFISEECVGRNRAEAAAPQIQKLNPRVTVTALNQDPATIGPDFFSPFTLVIATDLDFPTLSTLNGVTRFTNKPLYAAGAHGMYGYIFADLIIHQYQIERAKSNVPTVVGPESSQRAIISATEKKENGKTIELVTKQELYSPLNLVNTSPLPVEITNSLRRVRNVTPLLPCLRALWEFETTSSGKLPSHSREDLQTFTRLASEKVKELQLPTDMLKSEFLRSFLQNLGAELAPVTAFLGGMLAQDAINVLGARQQPIQNLVLFDGEESKGPIYAIHPIFDASLGMSSLNGMNGLNGLNGSGLDMSMTDLGATNGMNGLMPMGLDGTFDMNAMGSLPPLNGMNGMDMSNMASFDMSAMPAMGDMSAFSTIPMDGMSGMQMDANGNFDMSAVSGIPGMTMDSNGMMQMPGGTETSLDIPVASEAQAESAGRAEIQQQQTLPPGHQTATQTGSVPQELTQQADGGSVPNKLGAEDGPHGEQRLEGPAGEERKPISQQKSDAQAGVPGTLPEAQS